MLENLRQIQFERHAHTAELMRLLMLVNGAKNAPPAHDLLYPFARLDGGKGASRVTQAAARDFINASRRGQLPSWVIGLTGAGNLLGQIRAAYRA